VDNEELMAQVRELRGRGMSPKLIARSLGVPQAVVVPLVRAIAAADQVDIGEQPVVGCWVNAGWSNGLAIDGHLEWPDSPSDVAGLAQVLVAREQTRHRPHSVCGYLVDVYCLGVKNTYGPEPKSDAELIEFRREYFRGQDSLEVPLEFARHLVFGAVDYARSLGFEPYPDFAKVSDHLGEWSGRSDITFGKDGKPLFVQGPYDNASSVIRTLERTVGSENFDYVVTAS
jgi:hypothetical protein